MSNNSQCAKYSYVLTVSGPKIIPVSQAPCKDEESPAEYQPGGYLEIQVSDTFRNARYTVMRKLGWGHFSTVWLVKDAQEKCHSALKVVKSAGRYAETARDEIKLLSQVAAAAPSHPGREHIVSFLDSFTHIGPQSSHICIVFEPLGENLLGLIERNKKNGVPPSFVKIIARQVLLGLQYLHDECDLVHTDIKPENILISIPDVETHIYNELTHSPSPTSRRVGVPLPTKSRAGVSIPQNQQRPRRQVQIFESQPLSSPSSRSTPFPSTTSTSSSLGGSFAQSSPLTRFKSSPSHIGGTPSSLNSGSIVASGLSASAPRFESGIAARPKSTGSQLAATAHPMSGPSPSTSSSSSFSSTTSSSHTLSSSTISTPPTSLSHSLGNAVVGLMKMSLAGEHLGQIPERVGVPVNKGKNMEKEIEPAYPQSSSWGQMIGTPGSWKSRLSQHMASSSPKDTSVKSKRHTVSGHSRSGSGISGSWKDPGVSAPAPAVVVSATARPHSSEPGAGPDYFDFSNVSVASTSPGFCNEGPEHSQSSSGTVKEAKFPPLELHVPGPSNISSSPTTPSPSIPNPPSRINGGITSEHKPTPSLLSQTAPIRILPQFNESLSHHADRSSPQQHISQLSAHILTQPPPDYLTPRSEKSTAFTALTSTSPSSSVPPSPLSLSGPPNLNSVNPPAFAQTYNNHISEASQHGAKLNLSTLDTPAPAHPPIFVKIADLGNATPSRKHFTEDIQTRQYRAPEAILGRKDWDTRADMWSVACLVFELLTAEYLFDPQGQSELFTKDDDHMAQIMELLGNFPLEVKLGGKYSRELFDNTGALRYIKTLKPWPLKDVMSQKYAWSDRDTTAFCSFLLPMLTVDMKQRAHARDMIDHSWLDVDPSTVVQW